MPKDMVNLIQQKGEKPKSIKETQMPKYSEKAKEEVEEAVHEMKEATLKSGKSGHTVTSRRQAIAIGLSKARKAGGKVPKKKA